MHGDPRDVWTPPKLLGKEFEELILKRGDSLKKDGVMSLKRNGVKSHRLPDGTVITQKSFPDFTGTIAPHGRRMEIEAKACSQASFPLTSKGKSLHSHQVDYLLEKAEFGAVCYLAVHFNLKLGKTVTHDEFTVAIPVHPDHALWRGVASGAVKTLRRDHAREIGILIPWGFHNTRMQTLTPDIRVLIPEKLEHVFPFQLSSTTRDGTNPSLLRP